MTLKRHPKSTNYQDCTIGFSFGHGTCTSYSFEKKIYSWSLTCFLQKLQEKERIGDFDSQICVFNGETDEVGNGS